jgi:hypothetical protein
MRDDETESAHERRDIDTDALGVALARFGGTDAERRTVARQAGDLAASGKHARDRSHPLTVEVIVHELAEAREGSPADRWNWWMGALEVAYGGYEPFQVRRYPGGEDAQP